MPELPEVETVCNSLKSIAINQIIKQVVVRQPKLRWPIGTEIQNLNNIIIKNIYRRAKYILFDCQSGYLIMHLGMSGRVNILLEKKANITKHDHYDIILNNNAIIRYHDPRRFGALLWTRDKPDNHKLLINLGPEPFDKKFNAQYLFNKASNKISNVKQFIMNNNIVVGVGNIYANEALFVAGVNPVTAVKNIELKTWNKLVIEIKKILRRAILQGGTSLRDFFDPEGRPGYFAQNLKVYSRKNQPCIKCNNIIQSIKLGTRSTFFCKTCQIL